MKRSSPRPSTTFNYGFRLVERGYRCVSCAGAELLHFEKDSRQGDEHPDEEAAFRRKYGGRVSAGIVPISPWTMSASRFSRGVWPIRARRRSAPCCARTT